MNERRKITDEREMHSCQSHQEFDLLTCSPENLCKSKVKSLKQFSKPYRITGKSYNRVIEFIHKKVVHRLQIP